ncbi:uncharacterized protein LOC123870789 [Maniola jurtina]|uniref:uncharacterized protein LOC123870789 n=1 Tax=Maniola jurtina TaxID=191418 RepID=UPI001E68E1DA|nr:uncharacterized protein LOC123870789 [Maniola jurtina]XP_045770178.1 uncharacterized protein LOC123870789 [Maniola jurtina]
MDHMVDRLNKLREERIAREKARIEKLRELNLKKYGKNDFQPPKSSSSTVSITSKTKSDVPLVAPTTSKSDTNTISKNTNATKTNLIKRSIAAPKTLPNKDGGKSLATNNVKPPNKFNEKLKIGTTVKTLKERGDGKNGENDGTKKQGTSSKIPTNNIKSSNNAIEKKISVINTAIVNDYTIFQLLTNTIVQNKENVDGKNHEGKDNVEEIIPEMLVTDQAKESNVNMEASKFEKIDGKNDKLVNDETNVQVKKSNLKSTIPTPRSNGTKNVNGNKVTNLNSRKSTAFTSRVDSKPKPVDRRKTMIPELKEKRNATTNSKESVFERLYKPKVVHKQPIDNATKLKTDPKCIKKVTKESQTNRRHTVFEHQNEVRRSISAIHFKRVRKSELPNCIHKWASIGDNINKEDTQEANDEEDLNDEKVISAVKSERKRVKFQTPLHFNINTPKPEELQSRLQNWLKKRGKSLDSYHHLQCFGLHHLSVHNIKPLETPKFDDIEENKENIALEHDSDNDSFLENNNRNGDLEKEENLQFPAEKWRSCVMDTSDLNDSYTSSPISGEEVHHVDELLLGALNDLTELLREGFNWEQSARWLRALRERFPSAPESAPYWECRAALAERQGDLHATVQCLEQAIAKGTEHSVVEANLDSLLDKFMQLKISPNCGRRQVDPKLVDVKNVFKSTIIRFAVQQAKLQSSGTPKYTVTPVRRSHRLSHTHTPLRVCSSIQQIKQLGAEFRPNKALSDSP